MTQVLANAEVEFEENASEKISLATPDDAEIWVKSKIIYNIAIY